MPDIINEFVRTLNGIENNPVKPELGEAETLLIRLFDPAYEDGISVPRGGPIDNSSLPNPRTISNIIADQDVSVPNTLGISSWVWQWAQFMDHDLDLNEGGSSSPEEDC